MAEHALPAPTAGQGPRPLPDHPSIGRVTLAMVLVASLSLGAFLVWAATAGLASAVGAPGFVSVESHRKTVQHLEGGIVAEIAVRNGAIVRAGDPLIVLENIRPRADLSILNANQVRLWATRTRLEAELNDAEALNFPSDLLAAATTEEARQLLRNEEAAFAARRAETQNRIAILEKRIGEYDEQAAAAAAQQTAVAEQRRFILEELAGTRELYSKGYAAKTKVLALERAAAGLQGEEGAWAARVSETREAIGKTRLEILDLRNARQTAAAEELRLIQAELDKVVEQLAATRDVLGRTVIRAPEDGIVQNLRVHTIGGVLPPGGEVMDLVPQNDRLLMDVKVRPEDIDVVHVGQHAETYLLPYEARRVPPVKGTVSYVSADALVDEATGYPYYAARVEVDPDALNDLGPSVVLHPGMPVTAMIILGDRTVLDYFLSPFWRLAEFGMREE